MFGWSREKPAGKKYLLVKFCSKSQQISSLFQSSVQHLVTQICCGCTDLPMRATFNPDGAMDGWMERRGGIDGDPAG